MATEQMTIYVPPQVKKEIKQRALMTDQQMNTVIVEALEMAISKWSQDSRW